MCTSSLWGNPLHPALAQWACSLGSKLCPGPGLQVVGMGVAAVGSEALSLKGQEPGVGCAELRDLVFCSAWKSLGPMRAFALPRGQSWQVAGKPTGPWEVTNEVMGGAEGLLGAVPGQAWLPAQLYPGARTT